MDGSMHRLTDGIGRGKFEMSIMDTARTKPGGRLCSARKMGRSGPLPVHLRRGQPDRFEKLWTVKDGDGCMEAAAPHRAQSWDRATRIGGFGVKDGQHRSLKRNLENREMLTSGQLGSFFGKGAPTSRTARLAAPVREAPAVQWHREHPDSMVAEENRLVPMDAQETDRTDTSLASPVFGATKRRAGAGESAVGRGQADTQVPFHVTQHIAAAPYQPSWYSSTQKISLEEQKFDPSFENGRVGAHHKFDYRISQDLGARSGAGMSARAKERKAGRGDMTGRTAARQNVWVTDGSAHGLQYEDVDARRTMDRNNVQSQLTTHWSHVLRGQKW